MFHFRNIHSVFHSTSRVVRMESDRSWYHWSSCGIQRLSEMTCFYMFISTLMHVF